MKPSPSAMPTTQSSGDTTPSAAQHLQLRLQSLRQSLESCQGSGHPSGGERLSTGWSHLDEALGGGLLRGALNEVASRGSGTGILEALLPAFLGPDPTRSGSGFWAWVSSDATPYPPALEQLGFPLERWLILRPREADEEFWAIEQILRSGLCAGLVMQRRSAHRAMDTALRRFQLAARESRTPVLLLSQPRDLQQASPAPLRILSRALRSSDRRRRLQIDVTKTRGRAFSHTVLLEWSHDALDEPPISRTLAGESHTGPATKTRSGLRALRA